MREVPQELKDAGVDVYGLIRSLLHTDDEDGNPDLRAIAMQVSESIPYELLDVAVTWLLVEVVREVAGQDRRAPYPEPNSEQAEERRAARASGYAAATRAGGGSGRVKDMQRISEEGRLHIFDRIFILPSGREVRLGKMTPADHLEVAEHHSKLAESNAERAERHRAAAEAIRALGRGKAKRTESLGEEVVHRILYGD
jgi:hypothetical protein